MKHAIPLILALSVAACGPMDYTSVTAGPGETFVIEGNIDQVGGAMDPMVSIMAAEACEGGTPERQSVETMGKLGGGRTLHTFGCV